MIHKRKNTEIKISDKCDKLNSSDKNNKYRISNKLFIFIVLVLIVCFFCGFRFINEISIAEGVFNKTIEYVTERKEGTEIKNAKLTFTGDIMCHDYQYKEAYNSSTGEYDFMHNFQDMKKYFESADLVIGNLETVFAGEEAGISNYPCFNSPDSFLYSLKDAGFDLLTTANNHCMDKKMAGALRTLDLLDDLDIAHVGTYRSQEERDNIYMREVNGIKIAFLSYTYGTNGISIPESWLVNILDENLIKNDINKAKQLNPDFIVVMPHMGNEYEEYVRDVFKNWAHMMIEAGADIVVASHPHILQKMEMVNAKNDDGTDRTGYIMYSMGNFISSQTTPPRNASILLNIELEKIGKDDAHIKKISFIPIWTQFQNANWKNHFVVRSVYEMLTLPEDQLKSTVRSKDIPRLKNIHYETTKTLLNQDIPLENIQNEYIFYEN